MVARKTTKKNDNTTSKTVGTGVGLAGGAATGAAVGSLAGPVGTAVGAVVGAVAGGFAGNEVAELIDPEEEEKYWEEQYPTRPYHSEETSYEEYRPAYRYGVEAASTHRDKNFDEVESRLRRNWTKARGSSNLSWNQARDASRDAYDRTLQLCEERLRINKEQVNTGEVDVHKEVRTEHQKMDVPVEHEEVVVTRRRAQGGARNGGIQPHPEEIRIPVREERVRVTKETVPTEEVSVQRRKVRDVHHVDETVRKEEVKVEEKGKARVRDNYGSGQK